jgi:hypothetical protein
MIHQYCGFKIFNFYSYSVPYPYSLVKNENNSYKLNEAIPVYGVEGHP